MIRFTATIHKFDKQGEKTGWSYIVIPAKLARQLKPANKKSFRVKGKLDHHAIEMTSLLPMGEGDFILPMNAKLRKATGKRHGEKLEVQLEEDKRQLEIDADLMACLHDEPDALEFFGKLPASHQRYFSKWIQEAKTEATRTKRIAQSVNALSRKQGFGEMLRALKKEKSSL
jgi:hypothetical protein